MKKSINAASFVLLMIIGFGGAGLACGDKLLVPSRGTRYHVAPALRRPAAIV